MTWHLVSRWVPLDQKVEGVLLAAAPYSMQPNRHHSCPQDAAAVNANLPHALGVVNSRLCIVPHPSVYHQRRWDACALCNSAIDSWCFAWSLLLLLLLPSSSHRTTPQTWGLSLVSGSPPWMTALLHGTASKCANMAVVWRSADNAQHKVVDFAAALLQHADTAPALCCT